MKINRLFLFTSTLLLALWVFLPAGRAAGATQDVCQSGCSFTSIQAAIDASAAGGTVRVYPGSYSETAANRRLYDNSAPYQFGFFIGQDKAGLIVVGVDSSGQMVTDPAIAAAVVTTNATNSFGPSGIFVAGDGVTISGLEILPIVTGNNKTIEVLGDD